MARPTKEGLTYFPLDTHLEDKAKLIEAKYNLEGFAILIKLYQKIYFNGYYIEWKEENALLFSNEVNADINQVNDIINDCLCWKIFDKCLYDKYSILTSHGVQKRYTEATKRRTEVKIYKEYNLLNDDEIRSNIVYVYRNRVNVDINSKKEHDNEQSKVKESKVKESKEEESKTSAPIKKIFDLYNQICTSLPSARKLSDSRRRHIKARWEEEKDISVFEKVFKKAEASSFMAGKNNRGWVANLDWIVKNNTNFNKVLEGKYDDKEGDGSGEYTSYNRPNKSNQEEALKQKYTGY
ncbi:protein of unknown function [Orenia metallireducens]|uniref:Lin1244/Lin1753-like N-terminal domain-containing protein n=1 Tax=Orenia metallireducens TaxID=1413210 RepID=A0A285G7C4_9FIRM|nr:DUF4373 domain-containing protein [Orenia metallireducens]SNY19298.1 protein of unknown function [Orenia metallireducens]